MEITNETELKEFLANNLLPMEEARKITDQSISSFNQSVATNRITPFYQTVNKSGRVQNKLYLKSDLEEYYRNKRIR